MIRPFSIFDKLNHIHISDRQWLERESASMLPAGQPCPSCGARGCMSPFAHYTRYLVELHNGHPVTHEVTLSRVRCTSCGHTHAIHSSSLVPYRSYSLRFFLCVLRDYYLHAKTVRQICETFGIVSSTFYRMKELFLRQKALWLGALQDLEQDTVCFLDGLCGEGLRNFADRYRFSFLEGMPGRVPELPFPVPEKETAIT